VVGLAASGASAATSNPLSRTFVKTSDWEYRLCRQLQHCQRRGADHRMDVAVSAAEQSDRHELVERSLTKLGNTYTVTNASWNGALATAGTATFRVPGHYSGAFVAPNQCTLNGQPCSGATGGTGSTGRHREHRRNRLDRFGQQVVRAQVVQARVVVGLFGLDALVGHRHLRETSDWGSGFVARTQS